MTEQEWLHCADLDLMLAYLEGRLYHWNKPDTSPKASDRKMRLYACACCRRIWNSFDAECRRVVELAECFADGLLDEELFLCWRQWIVDELYTAQSYLGPLDLRFLDWGMSLAAGGGAALEEEDRYLHQLGLNPQKVRAVYAASWPVTAVVETVSKVWPRIMTDGRDWGTTYAHHSVARSLAGVFPSRPQDVPGWWDSVDRATAEHVRLLRHIFGNPFHLYSAPASWPALVIDLARQLYDGTDVRLVLHDALLDAGHAELAEHFRDEEWHPKGCFAVDLLLGKK